MGLETWAAFECSSLAAHLKNNTQQERLFLHGYEQGQAFISAVRAGKVERQEMRSVVPIGLVLLLEGPTPDFMLGRIYENAQDNALKDVYGPVGELPSPEIQARRAESKFLKANCALIGGK